MQKQYTVDMELQKKIIAEMYKQQQPKLIIWVIIYRILYIVAGLVFLIPTISVIPMIIEAFSEGYSAEAWGMMVIILLAFCFSIFIWLIPYAIHFLTDKKYMWKWFGRTLEYVQLQNNAIRWSYYSKFKGRSYWEYQIQYKDIQKIEYNSKEKVLYVYGYMSSKEWDSEDYHRCLDTITVDRTLIPVPWMTLPAYFENFEELRKNLSEVSGHKIMEV